MSGSMANYTFGDTPSADANKLQWVKIKDGDKTLLICDRVILVNVSWDDLNGQGYVTGKTVTIDGAKYKCRLLTGGSNRRNGDSYAGGTPTNNEWDRFITREEVISGLPAPVSSDLDSSTNSTDLNSAHNKFWNWFYVYSWCQETYAEGASGRAHRGYDSARYWDWRASSYRYAYLGFRPVLEILNTDPLISDSDRNLGDKNQNFTIEYTVDDADGDEVTVVEKLNDEVLRTVNNAPKGEQLSVSITSEKLYALGLNTVNNLVISASDGQGGTTYRRLTFKRTNSAPAISGQDEDLGQQTGSFAEKYTVTDVEGDNVVVTEFIDDKKIRSYQATLGQEETIELSRENWLTLTNGAHQLRVEAVDGNFATSVRVWNFSKKETVIAFQFAKPEETDARATKILITPTWHIEGSVAKVEACNNAFDDSPAWEDITAQVAINRVYNFLNESKTAEKWGVNVRFTITKNEGYEEEVSISGFGGAYE